jgi:hypothetical protein
MYIHRHGRFVGAPVDDLKYYKEDVSRFTKLRFRRANRFVLISLAGACRCVHGTDLSAETAVYLTTENGNLGDTETVLHQIFHKREFPMPYNFINTMSNTASYYVAQTLNLSGRNITFSSKQLSFERGLELLQSDLAGGSVGEALIGGVDEAVFSKAQFENRLQRPYDLYKMVEGSSWLLVRAERHNAVGEIRSVASPGDFKQTVQWLRQQELATPVVLSYGFLVGRQERAAIGSVLQGTAEMDYISELGYFDSAAAGGIVLFLERFEKGTLVHVNTDFRGQVVVTIVEKY